MRNIACARIDEKLIHGQAAAEWMRDGESPNEAVIVDDRLVGDALQGRVLRAVASQLKIALKILGAGEAASYLKEPCEDGQRILVVAKAPGPVLQLVLAGIPVKEVILGNMGAAPGRTRLTGSVSASEEEAAQLRGIVRAGVPVYLQQLPSDPKVQIEDLLR